jgi:uncharacterized repeat protein (TIGR02543 family)
MLKKRNLIFFSLLILGVLLLTSCLPKPPVTEGILKGQVIVPEGTLQAKDLTGQALSDATVNIIDPVTGDIIATTTTDANGYYQVFVPAGGPYILEAIKEGVKLQQVTPQVEIGIEYELGTADCNTTAVSLIVQAMLEAEDYPDDLADINLATIVADPDFNDVMSIVCSTIEAGGDPTELAVIEQAVEDFLYPPAPAPTPTPDPDPDPTPTPTPTPTPEPTYTVIYNGNGSTGGTVPAGPVSYAENATVTVLGNTGNLVKTQYEISFLFEGWNIAVDGSGNGGTDYTAEDTFNMGSANVTLYAQWSAIRRTGPAGGLIFYDKGDDSDGWRYLEAAPSDQSEAAWAIDAFESTAVPGGTLLTIGSGSANTEKIVVQNGEGSTYAAGLARACTESGYDDWFLPSKNELDKMWVNLRKGTDENNVIYTPVGGFADKHYWSSSESSAYRAWIQYFYYGYQINGDKYDDFPVRAVRAFRSTEPTYIVNYNANGATDGTVPYDSYHYEPGETVTVLGNTGTLVKTDYTFAGWNTLANGIGTDRAVASIFNMDSSNVTLYAKWMHTVTFDSQGGSAVASQNVNHGGLVTKPTDPTKTGYTFGGWYKESGCTDDWVFATDTVTSDVTLYAQWTINSYTVTYDGNGNTSGTVPAGPVDYNYRATVTVLGNTGTLVKTGWTFTGWNIAADGSGNDETDYTVGDTFNMGSENVTLYAQWTAPDTYSLRDVGPAGGLIFYDKGDDLDGWQYLEAAPKTTEWEEKEWGSYGHLIGGTAMDIGDGQSNTSLIVAWLDSNTDDTYGDVTNKTQRAAYLCHDLTVGSYSDWFLPSKDELNKMWVNLKSGTDGLFNYLSI